MPPPRLPVVGISTYPPNAQDSYELPADYVAATRRAGALAVLLPPGMVGPDAEPGAIGPLLDGLDALVLAGGGDVDPQTYDTDRHVAVQAVDHARDADELALVSYILETGLPTLAICRGLQVVNVALGGTLHQHLPDVVDGSVVHRDEDKVAQGLPGPLPHIVECEPGAFVTGLMGTATPTPMSWHHQAVDVLGDGLRAVAWAPDGTIEAVEHTSHPWLAIVQWHPELTAADDPSQQCLFDALVAEAGRAR